MKKVVTLALAVLLVVSCALPAFADSMIISTQSSAADYELSFPADTQIPWEQETTAIGEVKATKLLLDPGKVVAVEVESANSYALVNTQDAQKKIPYTLSGADSIVFTAGDIDKTFPLTVGVTDEAWRVAAAGEHTDTLTFVVEYKDA